MHNCYSNWAYMHGYCNSCIYYFTFFFSLLTLLSHFWLLLSPLSLLSLVHQSSLTDTIRTERRRDDISAWAMTSRPAPRIESSCMSLVGARFSEPMRIATQSGWYFEGFRFGSTSETYRSTRRTGKNCRVCYRARIRTTSTQVFIRGKYIGGVETIKHLWVDQLFIKGTRCF